MAVYAELGPMSTREMSSVGLGGRFIVSLADFLGRAREIPLSGESPYYPLNSPEPPPQR
jgi:hypothetical protein